MKTFKTLSILVAFLSVLASCNGKKVNTPAPTIQINLVDSNGTVLDTVAVNDSLIVKK